jgi:hypothetical protein
MECAVLAVVSVVFAALMLFRLAGLALRLKLRVSILQTLLIFGFALLQQGVGFVELLLQHGGIGRGGRGCIGWY